MASELEHESGSSAVWAAASDHELAVRAKQDRQLFGVLYDRYVDRIYRYCYRRLESQVAAEDATSQTFLKALTALDSYHDDAVSFRAWLFAIAHNIVVDTWRRSKPTDRLDQMIGLPDAEPAPEARVINAEQQQELHELIHQLPDAQAHLIHLRLGGLSDREIATILNRSFGAIRIAQHRALKQLKALADAQSDNTRTSRSCG